MLVTAPMSTESIPVFCEALGSNEIVHAKRQLYKNSSERINVHISYCVINRIGTCAESQKKAAVSKKQDHGQHYGDDDLHGEAVSQGTFSLYRYHFFPIICWLEGHRRFRQEQQRQTLP